jgi:hypothetical protein
MDPPLVSELACPSLIIVRDRSIYSCRKLILQVNHIPYPGHTFAIDVNYMHKALYISLVFLLNGCFASSSLEFRADTTVDLDGSVVRRISYSTDAVPAEADIHLEELRERYQLPQGGTWTVEQRSETRENGTVISRIVNRYDLQTRFVRGEKTLPDYVRYGSSRDHVAENSIELDTAHFGFLSVYSYRETFKDVVTKQGFQEAAQTLYSSILRDLGEYIAEAPGSDHSNAVQHLHTTYDSHFYGLLDAIASQCFLVTVSLTECMESVERHPQVLRLMAAIETDDSFVSEMISVFPAPKDVSDETWFERMEDRLLDFECKDCLALIDSTTDDLLGVHGFYLFKKYPFNVQLKVPGTLSSGNYHSRENDKVVWQFDHEDFQLHEYVVFAKSRVIYWKRILVSSFVLLIFALWRRQRSLTLAIRQ